MNSATTTKNGFKVEDITFRNSRRQSEIENEIEHEEKAVTNVKVPVSLTPEQVTGFYLAKIKDSSDSNEKRVYSQTILWIKELMDAKKKLAAIHEKEIVRSEENKEVDDIIEDISN